MLLITVLCLGAISVQRIPLEFMPPVDAPFLRCYIPYAGATPEQVEKEVAIPAEGEFRTLSSLSRVLTQCDSNGATITLLFNMGTDMTNATADVRDRMERLKLQLPDEIERIFVQRFNTNTIPIMVFSIYGPGDDEDLAYRVRTMLKPRLMRQEGVADITIFGKPEKEVLIEFDQDSLRNRSVGLFQVVSSLRDSSINVSAGDLTDGNKKYFVRTVGEFATPEEIGDLVIGPNSLRLRDVANVGYRTREVNMDFSIDGDSSTFLLVRKEAEANAVQTCENIHAELEKLGGDPQFSDVKYFMLFDQASLISSTLNSVIAAGFIGAIFAIITIFFFLQRIRPTLIVATAIPTSAVCALIHMFFFDMSLNIVTMVSFILAIGMLVDDSIVVIENIYRHRQLGLDRVESAVLGAKEVTLPMAASCLTTLVVFVPVFYLDAGEISTFMKQFATPMAICQIASLIIGITVIPLAVSRLKPRNELWLIRKLRKVGITLPISMDDAVGGQSRATSRNPFRHMNWWYLKALSWSLRNRLTVLSLIFLLFVLTFFVPMQNMQRQNMPNMDTRQVEINVRLDQGYDLEGAKAIFAELRRLIDDQRAELGVKNVFTRCEANGGDVNVYLFDSDDREKDWALAGRPEGLDSKYSTDEVLDILWQRLPKAIPGGELRFRVAEATEQTARAFALQLRGDDAATLRQYADRLKILMTQSIPDLTEVVTDTERRREEIQLGVRDNMASQYGLSPLGIAQTVDFALRGIRISYLKQGGREIPVWAQFQEEDRKSRANLENVTLLGEEGDLIPLNRLVDFGRGHSPATISRINGKNVVTITAKFKGRDMGGIMKQLRTVIDSFQMPSGYTVEFGDELSDLMENNSNFLTMVFLAIILVYIVLGATFESFILPLSILMTLPLAAIGSFWSIYLTGSPLDIVGMIGFILLIGIIVKNGIMIIDFIIMEETKGVDRYTAIMHAGRDRLRPVLMTASTTILGCLPIGIGSSVGGTVSLDGIGKIMMGGMVTGTVLTMIVVPVVYSVIDDGRIWFSSYFANIGRLLRPVRGTS